MAYIATLSLFIIIIISISISIMIIIMRHPSGRVAGGRRADGRRRRRDRAGGQGHNTYISNSY